MKAYKVVRPIGKSLGSLTTNRRYVTMKRYQNKTAPFFVFRTIKDAIHSGLVFHPLKLFECEVSEIIELPSQLMLANPIELSRQGLTNWWRRGRPALRNIEMQLVPTNTVLAPDFVLEREVWPPIR